MPHLRPRLRYFQSILRIRNELNKAIRDYMESNDFFEVQVPCITTNDCEGGGECFTLSPMNWQNDGNKFYFGRPVFLTSSGQLHLEALARAEKTMSQKHLSEFQMLEVEESFIFDLDTLLDRVEDLIKHLIRWLESKCDEDLAYLLATNAFETQFDALKRCHFIRISYEEARNILAENFPQIKTNNLNLNAQMERFLLKYFQNKFIFITKFPFELKPFYMKRSCDANTMDCFDLLAPISGEICGGSLREHILENLEDNLYTKNMSTDQLQWYLDLRRFGSGASGGFGLGFDRLIQTICGVRNIKDVATFPRWPYHCHL
ncbi:asparagine-tRNA ligase, mitochondrial-like protein [Sarcoptes scabiei]|uniref:Asparagine-tRNA ligase, mitochondrial-like protein n=1 Tax=Sarcoptes scabiei TaxID=52283 RepID=A0A132A5D6_SARSC|nr:asparagine-tRNA ligase, mitochondrial-like protein [Sarcoptes scabiei]